MHDIMRKRLWRKLDGLPDEQLYRVLDFIEFLESKYSPEPADEPSTFQRTAERFEDRLRARRLPPRVIGGTMTTLGAAGRLLGSVTEAGREALRVGRGLLDERDRPDPAPEPSASAPEREPPASSPEPRQRTVIPIE